MIPELGGLRQEDYEFQSQPGLFSNLWNVLPLLRSQEFLWLLRMVAGCGRQGPVCERSRPRPLSGNNSDLSQLAVFRHLLRDRRDSACFQKSVLKDMAVVSILIRSLEAWKALQYY